MSDPRPTPYAECLEFMPTPMRHKVVELVGSGYKYQGYYPKQLAAWPEMVIMQKGNSIIWVLSDGNIKNIC
jgi:hypothetical protein